MASVINNVFAIRELYVAGIAEDTSDSHGGNVLKTVLQDGPHFCGALVIEQRVKIFIHKFFD